MLDLEVTQSFDIDFEIYSSINNKFNNYSKNIEAHLKSDDIFKEFENYVNLTKNTFEDLVHLLNECNIQRMNFRTILIKMSKEKVLIEKLFHEEGETLTLKKLSIQEELKNKTIEKNLDRIIKDEETIRKLNDKVESYKRELGRLNLNIKSNESKNNSEAKKVVKTGVRKFQGSSSTLSSWQKNNVTNLTNITHLTSNTNSISNLNSHTTVNHGNTCNNSIKNPHSPFEVSLNNTHDESVLKKMFNLDFNTEKYNIISSSPLQTPSENKINKTRNIAQTKKVGFGGSNSVVNSPKKSNNLNISNKNVNFSNMRTERNENVNKKVSNIKKYSKSIDFESTNDYFHHNQTMAVDRYSHFENENDYLQTETDLSYYDFRDGKVMNNRIHLNTLRDEVSLISKSDKKVVTSKAGVGFNRKSSHNSSMCKDDNRYNVNSSLMGTSNYKLGYNISSGPNTQTAIKKGNLKSLAGLSKDLNNCLLSNRNTSFKTVSVSKSNINPAINSSQSKQSLYSINSFSLKKKK